MLSSKLHQKNNLCLEYCVEKYREYAPSKFKKLGPRVASRLSRNVCLSPSAVITSLIYLQRLKETNPEYLNKVPSSDLFIVSMMVASKYLFDDGTGEFFRKLFLVTFFLGPPKNF